MIDSYDPFAPAVIEDPYPFYAWLRDEQPVYYSERRDVWALSRYADVVAAARNVGVYSSALGIGPERVRLPMMINQDPPAHRRLRALAGKAFTPRRVAEMESRIRAIVNELLDAVVPSGSWDLAHDLAYPLPVIIIAELLGVEANRRDDFKRWSDDVVATFNGAADQAGERYQRSWQEFKAYFSEQIGRSRQQPGDDLIGGLVRAEEQGEQLTPSEMLNFCLLLLVAGNETTTNLISNGVMALFAHPDQLERLRREPGLVECAIEEMLRYDSPVQGFFRTTTREVELHGVTIPEDSKVLLLWGSANRDGREFPEPQRFDIARSPNNHLAFGEYIHFCLGAPLARLEAKVALQELLRRQSNLRPDDTRTRARVPNPFFRGFHHLPVRAD